MPSFDYKEVYVLDIQEYCRLKNWDYGPCNSKSGQYIRFECGETYLLPRCIKLMFDSNSYEKGWRIKLAVQSRPSEVFYSSIINKKEDFIRRLSEYLDVMMYEIYTDCGYNAIPFRRPVTSTRLQYLNTGIFLTKEQYLTPHKSPETLGEFLTLQTKRNVIYNW